MLRPILIGQGVTMLGTRLVRRHAQHGHSQGIRRTLKSEPLDTMNTRRKDPKMLSFFLQGLYCVLAWSIRGSLSSVRRQQDLELPPKNDTSTIRASNTFCGSGLCTSSVYSPLSQTRLILVSHLCTCISLQPCVSYTFGLWILVCVWYQSEPK